MSVGNLTVKGSIVNMRHFDYIFGALKIKTNLENMNLLLLKPTHVKTHQQHNSLI